MKEVKNLFNKSKTAFTLAEVLITLVIVGVVAALTIPSIVVKYQKQQTVTKLKKIYSTLSQVNTKSISDNGPMKNWDINNGEDATDKLKNFLAKYIVPYIQVSKMPTTIQEGKWDNIYYNLNGNKGMYNYYNPVRMYMADGTSLTYRHEGSFVTVYIDINGDNRPNKFGRDIFIFSYRVDSGNKFIPTGFYTSGYMPPRNSFLANQTHQCHKEQSGLYCAALIMIDNWQIKDDYPW